MEYIQCSHCQKKYGINDKVRAATGRMVACKNCGESFEIAIFETPTATPPTLKPSTQTTEKKATSTVPTNDQQTQNKQRQDKQAQDQQDIPPKTPQRRSQRAADKQPHEAKLAKKFSPSMILGVLIIAVSVYFFYHDRSMTIGQPFVPTDSPQPTHTTPTDEASTTASESEPLNSDKPIVYEQLSHACKAIAAQQWLLDYTSMHGSPDADEYNRMLDEGTQNSARIRKECGSSRIVHEVLATASKGTPPAWLAKQVQELMPKKIESHHF